jgi:HlyD family secretion protein
MTKNTLLFSADSQRRRRLDKSFRIWPRVLLGLSFGAFLIAGCGGWAALAGLDGAVIAAGIVKVDQNLKEVQHRDGGTVKAINVRQGEFVKEGQVLITVDEVQTKAELLIVKGQLAEAVGRKARLTAERDGLPEVIFPADLKVLSPTSELIAADETRLFAGNKSARDSQKEQLRHLVGQSGEEIRGLESRLTAKNHEVELVGAERTKFIALHQKGIIPNERVFTFERDWSRVLGERGEILASIARVKARISEVTVQLIAVDQNASTEAQRELRTVDSRMSELLERKVAIEDRLSRSEIRAPIAGYVNELFIFTVGGVIAPAAKLATIVPEGADLRFEVKIAPPDIDQVRKGQEARIRLSAFNRNLTPEMKGNVAFVSPASTRDATSGQEHYIAQIQLSHDDLPQLSKLQLIPGMPVEAFIKTDERTAMSYLVKPIHDQFSRAFRER